MAVDVSSQDVASLSVGFASTAAWDFAFKALIEKLMAANASLSFETALASVVAQVSAAYNPSKASAGITKEISVNAIKEAILNSINAE